MERDRPLILVVDDDPDILRILKDNLELDNYEVCVAGEGKEALRLFETRTVSLVVLDLSLPDIDGIQVCRLIRAKSGVPIIMLTARDRVPDKVLGLETGADDYMSKPFDYLELSARIKVCLRRGSQSFSGAVLEFGELKIDPDKKSVTKSAKRIELTQREFGLLEFLAHNYGKAMERTAIRKALWPEGDLYHDSRAIDVHVQHLRSKLEDNPSNPQYIITVQGVGYMLTTPERGLSSLPAESSTSEI